jgi:hypothetical protein
MASPRLSTTTALIGPVAIGALVGVVLGVVGLPWWGAALLGVGAWAVGVLFVRSRARATRGASAKPRKLRIDPFALSDPWRRYVQRAQSAKLRYDRIVQGTKPGPMRERLGDLGRRLDKGVEDCWRIASRGDDIDGALANLNLTRTRNELAAAEQAQSAGATSETASSTIASLQAQLAAAERMRKVSDGARDRLRLLDARLSEILTNATEVSVGATDDAVLTDDVDGLLAELEAVRSAMDETERVGRIELPELPEPPPPMPPTS